MVPELRELSYEDRVKECGLTTLDIFFRCEWV